MEYHTVCHKFHVNNRKFKEGPSIIMWWRVTHTSFKTTILQWRTATRHQQTGTFPYPVGRGSRIFGNPPEDVQGPTFIPSYNITCSENWGMGKFIQAPILWAWILHCGSPLHQCVIAIDCGCLWWALDAVVRNSFNISISMGSECRHKAQPGCRRWPKNLKINLSETG